MTELRTSILRTIAYASVMRYPLTLITLHQWLWRAPIGTTYQDTECVVEELVAEGIIIQDRHHYVLAGDQDLVEEHAMRYIESLSKIRRARRFIWLMSWVPFVRGFAIVNALALDNVQPDSDIDLAIIVRRGRLWTARFFSIGLLKLLRVRPQKDASRNTICISFFLSDAAMSLEHTANSSEDIVWKYWIGSFRPIWEARGSGTWERYWKENEWLTETLPHSQPILINTTLQVNDAGVARWKRIALEYILHGKLGSIFDRLLEKFQRRIMPLKLRELEQAPGTSVVMNTQMLKFHSTDRRDEYARAWLEKCRILNA